MALTVVKPVTAAMMPPVTLLMENVSVEQDGQGAAVNKVDGLNILTQSWKMFILSLIKNMQRFFLFGLSGNICLTCYFSNDDYIYIEHKRIQQIPGGLFKT